LERSGRFMKIMQTKPDAFDITIEIRGLADSGAPVRLEIDGKPLSPVGLDPAYRARWQGPRRPNPSSAFCKARGGPC
jgi:hypothetical protein